MHHFYIGWLSKIGGSNPGGLVGGGAARYASYRAAKGPPPPLMGAVDFEGPWNSLVTQIYTKLLCPLHQSILHPFRFFLQRVQY